MARHTPAPAFAAVLEQLRLSRKLTAAELARAIDVDPTLVSRWRRGLSVPSIQAIETLALYFGVDRYTLESLAGYRANNIDSSQDTIDPALAAMLDEERAALEGELKGIPGAFHSAILNAQRVARQQAMALLRLAKDQPAISLSDTGELAPPNDKPRIVAREVNPGESGPLTRRLQLAGAH